MFLCLFVKNRKVYFIMETKILWEMVQGQIGYQFKNPDLLRQAFTRSSYAREKGGEDNEVLEFIGDKALDLAVIRLLVQKYGHLPQNNSGHNYLCSALLPAQREPKDRLFHCDYGEGHLSRIKSRMACKKTLAGRMDELGFAQHLMMGKGDIQNHIDQEDSVKEDLFEAIVGAVALDCGWNLDTIQSVVEAMLVPEDFFQDDTDTNYVRLIQEWEMEANGCLPWYKFEKAPYSYNWYTAQENIIYATPSTDYAKLQYRCYLKLLDTLPIFCSFGVSVRGARMAACEVAYSYLDDHGLLFTIRDEIENPRRDMAINQLETLSRRGYFSLPSYSFTLKHDENGNPLWTCVCHIEEEARNFSQTSSSKKDAKKDAAYRMLMHVLETEE